jgi:hypothetical protein
MFNPTVRALADGSLKISGAFGEETSIWEDVGTFCRSFSEAYLPAHKALGFTLIPGEGAASKTAFGVLGGIQK